MAKENNGQSRVHFDGLSDKSIEKTAPVKKSVNENVIPKVQLAPLSPNRGMLAATTTVGASKLGPLSPIGSPQKTTGSAIGAAPPLLKPSNQKSSALASVPQLPSALLHQKPAARSTLDLSSEEKKIKTDDTVIHQPQRNSDTLGIKPLKPPPLLADMQPKVSAAVPHACMRYTLLIQWSLSCNETDTFL